MKNLFMTALLIFAGASTVFADNMESVMNAGPEFVIQGYRMQPCRFWSRDRDSFAYVCDSLDMRVDVATVSEVQQVINQLVARIQQLEARVQNLEQAGP